MPQIEVSHETNTHIEAIALLLETTPAEVVERLVRQAKGSLAGRWPTGPVSAPSSGSGSGIGSDSGSGSEKGVAVYLTYFKNRVEGTLVPRTGDLTITSPWWGGDRGFGSPSGAARAVIRHFNPDRVVIRNGKERKPSVHGWKRWRLVSNGEFIQTVRPV